MSVWKWVGLAGVVSVAVVGVAAGTSTMRSSRREFADAPNAELRQRLHDRLGAARRRTAAAAVAH